MNIMVVAGLLILSGILLAVRNLGVPFQPWLGPALLIGLGLLALLFPQEWEQWRRMRAQRRSGRRDR